MRLYNRPTVSLYLDTRKPLASGLYPVVVRVTFKVGERWVQRPFSLKVSMGQLDWAKVRSGSARGELHDLAIRIYDERDRAQKIIDKEPKIDPKQFKLIYTGKSSQSALVKSLFTELSASMEKEGRISSAGLYKNAMDALLAYGGDGLTLDQIDADWLRAFEKKSSLSTTTIGIYLRNLRAVFHVAIDRKIISMESYPFGRKRYVIPSSRNIKKALNEADKKKLIKYRPKSAAQLRALQDWSFSYFCNGMNFSDMAHLEKENIRGDVLSFRRKKTMRGKRDAMPLVVILRKEALEILRHRTGKPYLFGVIDETDDAKRRKRRINDWIIKTNRRLATICRDLGIERVTTYTARHTAATMLLRGKTSVVDIRDALGHSSVTTTENYLASLDLEQKRKMSERL